jgi:hypothetical protein
MTYIITGCGRSGTSAVAKLLHRAGISVGRDLVPADKSNADGYFEERAVIAVNDAIVEAAGLHPWFSTASRGDVIAAARPHLDAMRGMAREATPAWKDPRFAWTLEAWLPALPSPPRLIVCLRSPDEVAASTLRYYGRADDEEATRAALHVWRSQYERLLDVINQHALDAVCVEYSALQNDTMQELETIERFVGCPLAAEDVRRDLRHHELAVAPELGELYGRVRALSPRAPTAVGPRDGGGPTA